MLDEKKQGRNITAKAKKTRCEINTKTKKCERKSAGRESAYERMEDEKMPDEKFSRHGHHSASHCHAVQYNLRRLLLLPSRDRDIDCEPLSCGVV